MDKEQEEKFYEIFYRLYKKTGINEYVNHIDPEEAILDGTFTLEQLKKVVECWEKAKQQVDA